MALAVLIEGVRFPGDFTVAWTVLYAGLGASAFSYILWCSLLRQRAASQVAALLGSSFGSLVLLGGAAIVAGIWLVNLTPTRRFP